MQYMSLSTCVTFYYTDMKLENYGNFLEKYEIFWKIFRTHNTSSS